MRLAGLLLAVTGYLFWTASFTLTTHLLAWSSIFFFASAGASAAYLTVSEIFPMEIRAMAIAFFFMVAQGAGIIAPWLYGRMIETSVDEYFLRLSAWGWIDAGGRCGGAHAGRQGRRPFVGTDRRSLIGTADHRGYVVRRLIRFSRITCKNCLEISRWPALSGGGALGRCCSTPHPPYAGA